MPDKLHATVTADLDPIVDARTLDVEVMARLKLATRVGVAKSLERLPELIRNGEELVTMASGFLAGTSGLVVITSDRLLFVTDAPAARFEAPMAAVRRLPQSGAFNLTLQTASGTTEIKQVHPREQIKEILDLLPPVDGPQPTADPSQVSTSDRRPAVWPPLPSGGVIPPAEPGENFWSRLRASRQEWTRKLARRRQEAARPSEEQAREKSNREYEQAKAAWDVDDGRLRQLLDMAKSFTGGTAADHPGIPLQLKGGERVFLVAQDVALVEPRRGSGHWTGGYSGFSFRIAKGIRYHVGGSRGHYVQGEERPTPVDAGAVTITNRRVVFQGAKKAREWAFNKLLGYQHDSEVPLTLLSVSNRQAVSGFLYDREHAEDVHFRLALGIADCNGARDDLVHQIETEIEAHGAQKPRSPTGGPTA